MNKVIAFVLGAAAGSLVTWKLVEKKYKDLADEEIESVIQRFKERYDAAEFIQDADRVTYAHKDITDSIKNIDIDEYKAAVGDMGYSTPDEEDGCIYIEPGVDYIKPYVITPDEYGERDDLDTKSWTYYADFVLTDEIGEIVSEPEEIIGDALAHFGEYEDDSVFVRNENTECDYEILKHEKTFSEINRSDAND